MDLPDAPSVPKNHDIVTLVFRDHELLARQFASALDAEGELAVERLRQVAFELVRHESAEEVTLYPALRQDGADGASTADRGLAQQAVTEGQLADLERAGPEHPDFASGLAALAEAVASHAAFEQEQVLPLLAGTLSDEERFELGDSYAQAKKTAPTHPHPHVPGGMSAKVMTGPIVAAIDRVRDAVHAARPRANRSAGPN